MSTRFATLNFPNYKFRYKKNERNEVAIFDICRKKFIVLTPEEWVRQHLIHFLMNTKKIPQSLILVEKALKLNNTSKRFDLLIYSNDKKPRILIECKAPSVVLDQQTLDQALRYNLVFNIQFLVLSNGLQHLVFDLKENKRTDDLNNIPFFKQINNQESDILSKR